VHVRFSSWVRTLSRLFGVVNSGAPVRRRATRRSRPRHRWLRLETCEDRRMMCTLVSVTASAATVEEGATAQFVIHRDDTSGPLSVGYSIAGSGANVADNGVDYAPLGYYNPWSQTFDGSVYFADGVADVILNIEAYPDAVVENDELVTLQLQLGGSTGASAYSVASPGSATLTILDKTQLVSVTAVDAEEGGAVGNFTIRRNSSEGELVVNYSVAFAGTDASDFTATPSLAEGDSSVTFTPGVDAIVINVTATDDGMVEGNDQILFQLQAGNVSPSGVYLDSGNYALADSGVRTLAIIDDDHAPLAFDDEYTIPPIAAFDFDPRINDTDADADSLVAIVLPPSQGTLTSNPDGSMTYTPEPGFMGGTVWLSYYVTDGANDSEYATISIFVADLNLDIITSDYVVYNDDDDDGDGVLDFHQTGVVANEDDLTAATLTIENPSGVNLSGFIVVVEAGPEIHMWDSPSRTNPIPSGTEFVLGFESATVLFPTYVFIEGYQPGSSSLQMRLLDPSGTVEIRNALAFLNVFRITIERDDTPITNQTQDVYVGEKISLTVSTDAFKSAQWVVPGKVISNYNVAGDHSSAEVEPYTIADRAKQKTDFYWVDAGDNRAVSVGVVVGTIVGDIGYTRRTTFNVNRPTAGVGGPVTISATTTGSGVYNHADGDTWLEFATLNPANGNLDPGITFLRSSSFDLGTFKWVQTIDVLIRQRDASTSAYARRSGAGLDERYPYDTASTTADDPGIVFEPTSDYTSYFGTFAMYLMFTPTTPDAIPVPLRKLSWTYKADVTRTGLGIGDFVHTYDPNNPNPPTDQDATTHPEWNQMIRVQNLRWEADD
jgi:hypothetical protein